MSHEHLRHVEAVAQIKQNLDSIGTAVSTMSSMLENGDNIRDVREFIVKYNEIENQMIHLRAALIKFL